MYHSRRVVIPLGDDAFCGRGLFQGGGDIDDFDGGEGLGEGGSGGCLCGGDCRGYRGEGWFSEGSGVLPGGSGAGCD